MSKILDASCSPLGVVTSEGVPVPAAVVLSEGKKQSSGVLLMEADKARYVTSNASDIKDLITNVVALLDQVTLIVTALDAGTTSPGSAAALITQLGVLKVQFDLTKETLK